jgi:hypothetical protein
MQRPCLALLLLVAPSGRAAITFCAPAPLQKGDLLKFFAHESATRPGAFACKGALLQRLDASNLTLAEWNVKLLTLLLWRRRMTGEERRGISARLGSREQHWAHAREVGARAASYMLLKHTLHTALADPAFRHLAARRRGLWLEFGVLTGLSINITSAFLEEVDGIGAAHPAAVVDGFDTFTGLPEAWSNGKGGFYYRAGSFSWAARKRGPTPPVRANVRLHTVCALLACWVMVILAPRTRALPLLSPLNPNP